MRFFNTEGPVSPDKHYAIPPLDRVDIDEFLGPIRAERYFVLHAPRQTDKTSALIALRDLLNSGAAGNFRCVDVNVEVGQVARDDTACGLRAILGSLAENAQELGDNYPEEVWPDILAKVWGLTTHSSGCSPAGAAGGRDRLAGGATPCSRCCASTRPSAGCSRSAAGRRGWCKETLAHPAIRWTDAAAGSFCEGSRSGRRNQALELPHETGPPQMLLIRTIVLCGVAVASQPAWSQHGVDRKINATSSSGASCLPLPRGS